MIQLPVQYKLLLISDDIQKLEHKQCTHPYVYIRI